MKIYSLSNILILPLVLIVLGIFYYSETIGDKDFTIWVFIPVILLTVVLIFKHQINFWWHTKFPIPLDPPVKKWLSSYSKFYNGLQADLRNKYEIRLSLYMEGREFKSVGTEVRDVPEDIKGIIGSIPVMLSLYHEDYLIGDYDRIYLYKHPFPSPQHQYLHSVETNHEDGVLLFSLEHLLPGITKEKSFFNIGLYGFLDAFFHLHPNHNLDSQNLSWEWVERTGMYTREHIQSVTGLKDFNINAIIGVNYFVFPEIMKKNHPVLYQTFNHIFQGQLSEYEL